MKGVTICLPDSTSSAARAFKFLPLRAPRLAEESRLRSALRCGAGCAALPAALCAALMSLIAWRRAASAAAFAALSTGQTELTGGVIGARVVA